MKTLVQASEGKHMDMEVIRKECEAPRRVGGNMGGGRDSIRLVAARRHPVKQLFLNAEERRSFDDLVDLLSRKNLHQVNRHLKAVGMSSGFTCLFYGALSTGKTEAAWLSEEFVTFAGGQIANVAREVTLDEVLHGERTPLDRIATYCRQEYITNARNSIGFVV